MNFIKSTILYLLVLSILLHFITAHACETACKDGNNKCRKCCVIEFNFSLVPKKSN